MPRLPTNAKAVANDLESAAKLLSSIMETSQQQVGLDFAGRSTSKMVYTHGVTLWMLILQRLGRGKTLEEVVSHVVSHGRDLFPDNKRVREQSLSGNSGAYARARKRLPVEFIFDFSNRVCNYLGEISEPFADGQRAFILDGTTTTLAPTPALKKAYPPAPNQHGESVWPVARLMIANELQSGCALLPQIDPMYGENNASEAVQARRILKQLPARSIVLADSGFGIYSVAHHAVHAGHNFLFRLSGVRFKALRRRAVLIDEGPGHKTFHLLWTPSDKDRQSTPGLPADASLDVVIHEVDIPSDKPLYLVSDLEWDGPTAATAYRRRYDVEFDIRDFKVTLDAENIRAKSVEMFKKELYASVVAYNLVAQFRRQAAKLAQVQPRRLTFKGVWTTLKNHLLAQPACSMAEWLTRYDEALRRAAKRKLPNRSRPRNYPRKAHPRRQKSTKFEKAQRKKMTADGEPPTP
ncbi:MAG: transposase [Planctomycetia bacterium 21-64-5]|nr:MAG: transposase [Planctomycetia bacterium 21-64-5]